MKLVQIDPPKVEARDSLGAVPIPVPPTIGAFPLRPDFGGGLDLAPVIVVHTFDQPGLKTEQRYLMSPSTVRRFRFQKNHLSCDEYDQLKGHWAEAQGAYAQFPYTVHKPLPFVRPNGPIDQTETVMVRYENAAMSFDYMVALLVNGPGITFLEVPQTVPQYTVGATLERFPDSTLSAALADQTQEIVPLITITPRDGSAPLYLSNQYVQLNPAGTVYLPRLLDWSGITQSIGENSDAASMNFGNADGVWTSYANQVNLYAATVGFSFYHVQSGYLVNLWQGYLTNWGLDTSGKFQVNVSDGTYLMSLAYPSRKILRQCWKVYKGRWCPSTSSLPDCPKDYDSCVERLVPHSFGGIVVPLQQVHVKDNSTGVFGWGRSAMTSVTVVDDNVYQRPLQEVYTDEAMNVTCDVMAGRDESDFYAALGIVSEGPISGYNSNLVYQTLDGQPPQNPLTGAGWRYAAGADPANPGDYVGISQGPNWNATPPGSTFAGGIAIAEIRRTDPKGLQLSAVSDHAMIVSLTGGIGGWSWTGPGQRVWVPALANTVWVAVNTYLRAIGLRVDYTNEDAIPAWYQEQFFHLDQAMAMAAICDTTVPKLIGVGTELQYPFRGVLKEQKPVRQWIQEILNGALGFATFVNGKLWIGLRYNSSVLAGNAFTRAHILYRSLVISPPSPSFNWLVGNFGDEEFGFALNNVTVYDIDHASYLGTPDSPTYLTQTMNFVGISNKSQCARVITSRLRQEIGGLKAGSGPHGTEPVPPAGPGVNEQMLARNFQFKTTLLALNTMIGDVISLTDERMPYGGYGEGRVTHWALNPDWSIDIQASTSTDDMYDQVAGPKPVDVSAPAVPPETLITASGLAWMPNDVGPFADDPVYPQWERTFELRQEYLITTGGQYQPTVWVKGQMTVNQLVSVTQPRIIEIEAAAGGAINGPVAVYATVVQTDTFNQPAKPSNLAAVWVGDGAVNQKVDLTVDPADADPNVTLTNYDVYAGIDRRRMAWQFGGTGPPPATISIAGPLHDMTVGLPETAAMGIRIQAKHVWHAGIAGILVDQVIGDNMIQSDDFIGSPDNWIGQVATVVSNVEGDVPLWNFQITGFDASTGTLTVFPNCAGSAEVDSVQPGDVLIVLSFATSATASTITNTMWDNSVNQAQSGASGFSPGEEAGRIVRILRGTGAGQWRGISANTNDTLTVDPAWYVIPDLTSIFIVEEPSFPYRSETSQMIAASAGAPVEVRLEVPNLAGTVALVGGFLVDSDGNQTDDAWAVYRMIYIVGQPPSVRMIGPGAMDPTGASWALTVDDQTVVVDTSQNDIQLYLPPMSEYQGRSALVYNKGPNTTYVNATGSDTFGDGTTQVVISATGGMADITAAGVYQ